MLLFNQIKDPLKSIIASQIPKKIEQIAEFRKKYNDTVVSQVTVDQVSFVFTILIIFIRFIVE